MNASELEELRSKLLERIVEEDGPIEGSPCWIWIGSRVAQGYGRIGDTRAHRLSWAAFISPIPDGMFVCHHCDNPPCINPSHLFLGDHEANAADMVQKGRTHRPFGENNGSAVLTE